ncbi:hypothetical protein B0H19DRAFT_1145730 [Mycena capillaripes]|nr:hypothetical protein B0H19DRAFT_1145730 [Mycena capillaripes]
MNSPMESPFQDILRTNTVPSDVDCEIIRDLLQGPCKELADASQEVSRLQALVNAARRKRDVLKDFIDAHVALVSPARRLPEDILRGIFMAALSSTQNSTLNPAENPLLLCQICRSWRAVALTTPCLWASLHIAVPAPSKLPQITERITAWLQRSGSLPLDISLAYSCTADPEADITPLMAALLAVSRRWRNIHLALTSYSHLATLSSEDAPSLQSIAIRDSDSKERLRWVDPTGHLTFLATPSLRRVQLSPPCILKTPLVLESLTDLNMQLGPVPLPCTDARRILQQCPLLERCDLVVVGSSNGNHSGDTFEHITLQRLRHLSIMHAYIPIAGPHFLSGMTLPVLRSFHCRSRRPISPETPLHCLFPSTPHAIQCLKLDLRDLPSDTLLAALADMPLLQEILLVGEPRGPNPKHLGDPGFLSRFGTAPSGPATLLCPRLRAVELDQFSEVSDETLLTFIQARARPQFAGVVPFGRVACALARRMQVDILPALRDDIARGLVVVLKYTASEGARGGATYSPLEGLPPPPVTYLGPRHYTIN